MDNKSSHSLSTPTRRTLLVFQVADQQYGISSHGAEQITPMAKLHQSPGMPKVLAGFLNLAGEPVPVISLRSLFGQAEIPVSLWTPLIILREANRRLALLVDKVQRIWKVDEGTILPLPAGHVLNNCVEGAVRSADDSVLLLSPERLLLQQETRLVAELQQIERERLKGLEGVNA